MQESHNKQLDVLRAAISEERKQFAQAQLVSEHLLQYFSSEALFLRPFCFFALHTFLFFVSILSLSNIIAGATHVRCCSTGLRADPEDPLRVHGGRAAREGQGRAGGAHAAGHRQSGGMVWCCAVFVFA